ncbi:Cytoplasmic dynein 2 heavy chain 1 [Sciurus carolinensis]|uniref:Cytoplasmic dynein 2 heavy chain 1 n=1 Tax=Sciurus carolinensis TaxID=30640 RepID=A0AA41MDN6_SCICA|nr:Cytoplasmic dynein 2 heavy chain 1 [Sciurus carolinensis]
MAAGGPDVRKLFIFTTTQNYFGLTLEPWDQSLLYNCIEVNSFLDDGNQMLLRVQRSDAGLLFSDTIDFGDTKDKVLVFFKLRPEVITDENLHNNILVSSMLESPINSLYQAVRHVFAPVLLKDQEWSRNFDPKLQNLLSELEAGLGVVLRRSDSNLSKLKLKEDDMRGILTPSDEFQFWIEQAHRGNKQISKERASYFKELFETIAREFYNLDSLSLLEVVDLVETTRDVVDDVWRQTEHDPYPESRMLHLLDIIGGSFGRFVQKKLGTLNLWEDPYYIVKENLKAGISICEQWVIVCNHLTGQVWQRYVPHPWKNEKYFPETLDKVGKRLEEPLWKAAVSQYEKIIAPAEQKIAGKLKNYISEIQDSPQQLLQAFFKYKELVKRPTISKELMLERETLLARLVDSVKDFRLDFENRCRGVPGDASGPLSGKNLSEVVNNIVWVRQLELKVDDTIKIAEALLSDLSGFRSFHRSAEDLLDQFKLYEQEQFDDWSREIQSGLSDSRSGLCIEANSRIMELDPSDGSLKVHYSDRLVILLREVRQLSALGFVIPAKIQQVANIAQKFCKQAIILKQNSKAGSGGKSQITWDNPKELEGYIQKLQNAAERLATENRKLRKWHTTFCEKVVVLMNIDLLRQQQRWKDGLQELRTGLASVEAQEWIVIGQVDMEALVDKHLFTVHDWERNFKALKTKGKEVERLPSSVKVDCLNINCNPVKTVIDDLIQKLFDMLILSLKKSIQAHLHKIDTFVTDAMEILTVMPQSVEEIGDANLQYSKLQEQKPEILPLFQEAEGKNRLLRTVAGGGLETISNLKAKWDKFELMMESHQLMIKDQIEVMKGNVKSRLQIYYQELEKFKARWDQLKPGDDIIETGQHNTLDKSAKSIKEKKIEFDDLEVTRKKLVDDCHHFGLEEPNFSMAYSIAKDIESYAQIWALYEEFQQGFKEMANEDWITFRTKTCLFEEFLMHWHDRLRKIEEHSVMTVKLQSEVDKYKTSIPILKYVRGEHLSPDHWLDLFRLLGLPRGTSLEKLLFGDLLRVADTIVAKASELKDLNSRAQGEVTIREALRELDLWGVGAVFTLIDYEDSQNRTIKLIKDWKDIVNQVGDNRCLLQSLKDSPYYKGFEDKVSIWERKLAELDEYLQNLNHIQRKWVYLEPIFGRGALPKEQTRFNRVDEDFRLEKRSAFPRFYFIGDDDLLEILGQSTNPSVIQSHLKKLFAGINSVCFDEESKYITAMKSLEGEIVPFKNKVLLSNNVEAWLSDLALEMKQTLKQLLKECVTTGKSSQGAIDPSLFPSQILCLAEQIKFTEDIENAIKDHTLHQIETQLVNKLEHYTNIDTSSEDPGNTESGILELKLKALILDIIHNIDVVKQLNQVQVHTTEDWAWKKQVRFYMKSDHTCYVQMVDSELQYTYEYQGNAPKLVYTPLTDKCYLTLTQAMKMGLGGNPYGPAGTGKTESVKALGGLLGRQVLVFNCDEGIDVKSMGRIFVGLVKCGAWGCFDEFNRLEESVLSAVSMQIQTIQDALKNHRTVCELLGKEVEINSNSGIFITMNPAGKGYGGRQKLPDNLKQLFRPVAMSRPDNELIAEVILYSEGFKDAKVLGRKLVAIFNLSRELLTPQQHYDWGLRALKTVLRGSGNLLRQLKKNGTKQNADESHIVVQALRLNTMSKFTFADCTRFDALIKDVFPGIDFKEVEYEELSAALQQVFEEANYEIIPNQIKKALELYEQLRQRMGVVIVGPSGAGKSTLWRMLRAALCKIGKTVKQYTMNPKAMPRHQLLGHIDMDTREWSDGVLTNSARQVVREPQVNICTMDFNQQNDYVVETSLVGTVMNGLSHLHGCKEHDQFIINLIRGLGGNLNMKSRLEFTKEVFNWARESPPDPHKPMDTYYESNRGHLASYVLKKPENLTADDFSNGQALPVIQTPDMQRGLDYFKPWLSSSTKQPFILVGPEGCGKGMLLRYAFSQLRSTQIATVHCSTQTTSRHLLQKLSQTCMVISTNTGRVYRPKDCERLVLYLKDINLPKLDKWGTSTLVAFLQQVLTYQGFYDENLEWVGLENIQIVASMSAGGRLGRHKLTTRFTSIVRLCAVDYPEREQLQTIYGAYLEAVLHKNLKNHSIWGSSSKIYLLAGSMVQVYEQVRAKFTVDDYSHYFFTPCILTQWVLGLFRYDLEGGSSNHPTDYVLEIVAYEARRLFRDKIVGAKELHLFDNILTSVFQGDWGSDILDNMADSFYVTWGARQNLGTRAALGQPLPPHGKPLGKLNSADLKDVIKKGLLHYGRDNQNLDILLFQEVLEYMSRIDRVLSFPGGSLLLAGRSGVGRRTITSLVSHMHGAVLFSPKISRGYGLKQFTNDLKYVLNLAGIEAQQVVLLLEDYQFVHPTFLEMINSLLSSGEVPGLYTLEELEPLLLPLKDQASQDGFFGPVFNYFTYRIQQNLHIVLIMDSANLNFIINCESNPALHKKCQVLWMEGWSDSSMKKAGVSKLNEAKALVDELNRRAGEQSILLKTKQDEADAALQEITVSMQDASEQKTELERLKHRIAEEVVKIEERKNKIDDELKEVQPLVNEAKLAVGNIKPESLSEIRSLRMPPDVIRDILEGVLRLMGIFDTSWVSMKSFLAKRGVREDIATFDARNIPKEIRESVEELLFKNKGSFDPKNAKRASTAAAPLAAWVKANVQYSHVLERIQPLETEQAGLVSFQSRTSEAAKLEAEVSKAQETIKAAEVLINQLDREHKRWNAQSRVCPFLIDPSSQATEWLKTHLKDSRLEVINQQDSNFITALELSVRFGKTLIIQEMDGVEPVLYPLLRRDLVAQGPRYVVQIGDKTIDYNEEFRLFLSTRNPNPFIPPDAASIVTEVNFTTTRSGLRGQLLALTIQHEKPDLEEQKTKLLQQEEDKKIQLAKLEESLLETLATSQGNILENKDLIVSLNKTKASSALIQDSLKESYKLQISLDQERDAYLPLAESASKMYFIISDLSKINNMYHFSLAAFLRLFQRALQNKQADQLMFALHFVRGMHPELFQENIALPSLYQTLCFEDVALWRTYYHNSMCEQEFPSILAKKVSLFQQVLVVQALRPDRLQSAMALFACKALGLKELSPLPLNLKRLYKETLEIEPILIIISPGADPSQELQELANAERSGECYHQVAMGQGQADLAIQMLKECARNGDWLCLKNLHLVVSWLPVLEKDYRAIIEKLPEDDKPSFFGLPANIARSSQRMISSQNSNLIHLKVSPPNDRQGSPILSFIILEQFNAIRLVQSVHQSLAALSKVIRGTTLLSTEVQKLASALLNQKCPLTWQNKWEGPEDPLQYLRGLVARALAIQNWVDKAEKQTLLSDTLDLSELFHPDTFLNALRQETARAMGHSVDSLKFVASWKGRLQEAKLQIKISGLFLEGCSFDGNRLSENQHDSPSVSSVLPCFMGWIPQGAYGPYSPDECISLPVYTSAERDRVVTNIDVPCGGNQDQWIQCGAALFLKNQ